MPPDPALELLQASGDADSTEPLPLKGPATSSIFPFLDLPLELRREVYRHGLVNNKKISMVGMSKGMRYPRETPSILIVGKQVHEESLEVLYAENYFVFRLQDRLDWNLLSTRITLRNCVKIRHLTIQIWYSIYILRPSGLSTRYMASTMLGNLTTLTLMIRDVDIIQAERVDIFSPPPIEWLQTTLRYLHDHCRCRIVLAVRPSVHDEALKVYERSFAGIPYSLKYEHWLRDAAAMHRKDYYGDDYGVQDESENNEDNLSDSSSLSSDESDEQSEDSGIDC